MRILRDGGSIAEAVVFFRDALVIAAAQQPIVGLRVRVGGVEIARLVERRAERLRLPLRPPLEARAVRLEAIRSAGGGAVSPRRKRVPAFCQKYSNSGIGFPFASVRAGNGYSSVHVTQRRPAASNARFVGFTTCGSAATNSISKPGGR